MNRLLIIGCGDVVRRALPQLVRRYRVYALVRRFDASLRDLGVTQIVGDLDQPATLSRLAGLADLVLHSAPPADSEAGRDRRTQRLLAALQTAKSVPRRLVYISTSGVYGDCGGAAVAETRALNPQSTRASRRAAAEAQLRALGRSGRVRVSILRAPGIYATDRLPLERIKRGDPVLEAKEDSYSNHIHADDLARACQLALRHGRSNRVYNASDDRPLPMGEWFTRLAEAFELPPPPRVSREEAARTVSPTLLSFMRESRKLDNRRIKRELGLRLQYPDVIAGLAAAVQKPVIEEAAVEEKPVKKKAAPKKLKKKRPGPESQLSLFA